MNSIEKKLIEEKRRKSWDNYNRKIHNLNNNNNNYNKEKPKKDKEKIDSKKDSLLVVVLNILFWIIIACLIINFIIYIAPFVGVIFSWIIAFITVLLITSIFIK